MITDEMIRDALHRVADAAPEGHRVRAALAGPPRQPRRATRATVAAAAAGVVLLGVGAYGVASFTGSGGEPVGAEGSASPAGEPTTGTAGTECRYGVVTGTLVTVDGTELVLDQGERITVTTSEETELLRHAAGELGDIVAGSRVFVAGEADRAGERVAAETVGVGSRELSSGPEALGIVPDRETAEGGQVSGTVTEVGAGGFTVRTASDTVVEVTTSASTTVVTPVSSTLGELSEGGFTVARGSFEDDHTLAATSVQQTALGEGARRYVTPSGDEHC